MKSFWMNLALAFCVVFLGTVSFSHAERIISIKEIPLVACPSQIWPDCPTNEGCAAPTPQCNSGAAAPCKCEAN